MAKFIGRRVSVGIGRETSRGTIAAAAFTVPKMNITFDDRANHAQSGESLGSISGKASQAVVTQRFSEGQLEGEVNVNSFGLLLYSLFGSSSAASFNGAYKHTLTVLESNQHPSLTVHSYDPIGSTFFKNCMIDSLEMEVSQNEFVKFSASLKGKKGNDGSYTPSQAVDYKFAGRDLIVKVAATSTVIATVTSNLTAATALSVKELKLSIQKNADYDFVLGTLEPEDILNNQITIQGSLTLNYEDRTWRDYMTNGTNKCMLINLVNTRDTIGSTNPAFYLELPVVDFTEWESQRGNDDISGQTLNFTALLDLTNSRLIGVSYIVNTTASY